MKLGAYEIENPLILGPMAGVTDCIPNHLCRAGCQYHRYGNGIFPGAGLPGSEEPETAEEK